MLKKQISFFVLSILLSLNLINISYALDFDEFSYKYYQKESDKIATYVKLYNENGDTSVQSVTIIVENSSWNNKESWNSNWKIEETNNFTSSWTELTNSWKYIEFWYDKYYQTLKEQEADTKIKVEAQLNNYRNNWVQITDNKVNKLNEIVNRTFGEDYYILWIKFDNVAYFKFNDNFLVFYPYTINWDIELFNKEIKGKINGIITSADTDEVKQENLIKLLREFKISYFTVWEIEEENIKLFIWEQRNVKYELQLPFIADKYYKLSRFQDNPNSFMLYTVVDKSFLEKNNVLGTNTVTDKIQPFIYWKDLNIYYSLDYLNWNGYIQTEKGKAKVVNVWVMRVYNIKETTMWYVAIWVLALWMVILWMWLGWFHYNRKFKKMFQKTSEAS